MPRPPAGPPSEPPIGLVLDRTARSVRRAFDDALVAAGGSRPVWLALQALTINATANQRQLAEFVGIQGATLTHHLNAMEAAGLVTRERDPNNRRSHIVRSTPAGEALFGRLRRAAAAFDAKLRNGLTPVDMQTLTLLLGRIGQNALDADPVSDPSAGVGRERHTE